MTDTIVAIATAQGVSAMGVVRMSGPDALEIGKKVFQWLHGDKAEMSCRRLLHGEIMDPASRQKIDECTAVFFKGPKTYTCEDMVEVFCHGGITVQRVLETFVSCGARIAEPGEFTRRAYLSGRIDLAQAEAVMDVVKANCDAGLRAAQVHLSGGLSEKIRGLRSSLLSLLAAIEVEMEYPEETADAVDREEIFGVTKDTLGDVDDLLATFQHGKILREGARVAIIGRPNVGKSSLLNVLLGENRALVTSVPGTTRDTVEEVVDVCGVPVRFMDTAGIRQAKGVVEKLGVQKTLNALSTADLLLGVFDASRPFTPPDGKVLKECVKGNALLVLNKTDLPLKFNPEQFNGAGFLRTSARTGDGLRELRSVVAEKIKTQSGSLSHELFLTRARHRECLERAKSGLLSALKAVEEKLPQDILCLEYRLALGALGEVTGETVTEDLMDTIFREFCVGK